MFTWQLSVAYYLGFGISRDTTTAHHYARLAHADNHPLALVFSDLFAHTPTLKSEYAECIAGLLRPTTTCSGLPPLLKACFAGDARAVLDFLRTGANPNACTMDGCGLFHGLFMISNSELFIQVVDLLASYPSRLFLDEAFTVTRSVNTQWPLQLLGNPLAIAISVNSEKSVRALLLLGANPLALVYANGCFPKSDPRSSWTAFHVAVKYHCIEILRLMLSWLDHRSKFVLRNVYPLGSALTYSTAMERLAIHGPAAQERLALTIEFIHEWQQLNAVQPNGMSCLMQAIDFEDRDVVSGLLQADPGLASSPLRPPLDNNIFNFPIHFAVQIAARRDTPEALEIPMLINVCSQCLNPLVVPYRDHLGRTALHLAVTGGSDRTARWILQKRFGLLEVEDEQGRTPLHYCTSKASCDLLLKENGANVNHTDKQGIASLHRACYLGNHELTKAILQCDPHLHLANNAFGTPLHCAVIKGSLECVLLLLDAGAPLEASDALGNTALHVAARLDRHAIFRLLLSRGATRDATNQFGRDALSIALTAGPFGSKGVLSILRGQQASREMNNIPFTDPPREDEISVRTSGTSETHQRLPSQSEFQWPQEPLDSVPPTNDYMSPLDRRDADVRIAAQKSYDDRAKIMRQLNFLASNISYTLRSAWSPIELGVDQVADIISIYFDEALWRSPSANFFHENMLTTTTALMQGDIDMRDMAAACTAKVVYRMRPDGAYPGRDEGDLTALILGELDVIAKTGNEVSNYWFDSTVAQDDRLRNASNVMNKYRKWQKVKHAVLMGTNNQGNFATDFFSNFSDGEEAESVVRCGRFY